MEDVGKAIREWSSTQDRHAYKIRGKLKLQDFLSREVTHTSFLFNSYFFVLSSGGKGTFGGNQKHVG